MEKKRTVFDYLTQVVCIFGFTMLTLHIFSLIFGNSAKGFSAIFELGNQGVSTKIAFQFLCISVLITGIRFLFFTDTWIKKMSICLRTICMLLMVVIVIIIFIIKFQWFPVSMWQPWVMFFICFGICFLGSYLVMVMKERAENRQLEKALQKLKESERKIK